MTVLEKHHDVAFLQVESSAPLVAAVPRKAVNAIGGNAKDRDGAWPSVTDGQVMGATPQPRPPPSFTVSNGKGNEKTPWRSFDGPTGASANGSFAVDAISSSSTGATGLAVGVASAEASFVSTDSRWTNLSTIGAQSSAGGSPISHGGEVGKRCSA